MLPSPPLPQRAGTARPSDVFALTGVAPRDNATVPGTVIPPIHLAKPATARPTSSAPRTPLSPNGPLSPNSEAHARNQRWFAQQAALTRRRNAEEAVRLVAENRALESWREQLAAVLGDPDMSAAEALKLYRDQQREHERERRAKRREQHRVKTQRSGSIANHGASTTSESQLRLPQLPGTARTGTRTTGSPSRATLMSATSSSSKPGTANRSLTSRRAQRDVVLPALGTTTRAYVATTLEHFRTHLDEHHEFVEERCREGREAAVELRKQAEARIAETHESAARGHTREREQGVREARKVDRARQRRWDQALEKRAAMEAQHEAREAKREAAAAAKAAAEDEPARIKQWLTIACLLRTGRMLGRNSSVQLAAIRRRWRRMLPAILAARWLWRARHTIARRLELRQNLILGVQLPRHLERVRRRMYGPRAMLLMRFLRDMRDAHRIPRVVSNFVACVRRAQSMLRRHLVARRLWQAAFLLSWERRAAENLIAQFNATYPRDAVYAVQDKAKRVPPFGTASAVCPDRRASDDEASSGKAKWPSQLPRPQLMADAALYAMMRQRRVAADDVRAFGIDRLADGSVAPPAPMEAEESMRLSASGSNAADLTAAAEVRALHRGLKDSVIAFVPLALRVRIAKEVTAASAHLRAVRWAALPPGRDGRAPPPKLHRFVDKPTMRRLVRLVERKLSQLAVEDVLRRERDASRSMAQSAAGFSFNVPGGTLRVSNTESSGSDAVALTATQVFDMVEEMDAKHEASLRAPPQPASPQARDVAIAKSIVEAIVTGRAPPAMSAATTDGTPSAFELGFHSGDYTSADPEPLSPSASAASPTSPTSPTVTRRVRLSRMNKLLESDTERSTRVPMPVADVAAELADIAVETVLPRSLGFIGVFVADA